MTRETFGDGTTVTYDYDNTGALATVTDSATGIKTTYYYDLIDRMVKYVESGTGLEHSVQYGYDTLNNLSLLTEIINGITHTTSYTYDADNRVTQVTNSQTNQTNSSRSKHYTYDAYGRNSQIVTKNGSNTVLTSQMTFQALANGRPTTQISALRNTATGYDVTLTYGYDNNGNITSVSDGTNSSSYVYDSANQLIRENNQAVGRTWVWEYDDAGNILSRTEYPYSTGELGEPYGIFEYGYTDPEWGDLLTYWDGNTYTYDGIGNPLSDQNWTYTWQNGRELASMSDGTTTWTYTYDANGMRTSRTNGTVTYNYIYNGGQLVQMTKGTDVLYFDHATGTVTWNGVTYYYVYNLQGDVIAILDSAGTAVVNYVYDAWGNLVDTSGYTTHPLGTLNPLTYRAYTYDHDTGLYYLQSRYYNPEVGRFLNADALVATGQGLLGNNMFVYCANNPVIHVDETGNAYRAVGAGVQFELCIGSATVGIEIICYWDVDECANGGVVIAAYAYAGVSFDMSNPLIGSILATITDNSDMLVSGSEAEIMAFATLIGDTYSLSISGVLVTGDEGFRSTESYQESFTSVGGSLGKIKGSYAYSENCRAYSLGGNIAGGSILPTWSVSKTYYAQIFEIAVGQPKVNSTVNTSRGMYSGGGTVGCRGITRCVLAY